jgi:phosphomannomutase
MSNSTNNSHSSRLMISVSGIRGVVGQSLTPAHALEFVGAYAAYLWDKGPSNHREQPLVLLARDTRTSGEMMRYAALAALIGSGCRVIDLGIVSTPTLQLAIPFHQADGALCITASHNPADWNALKFFQPNGMYLDKAMGGEFLRKREAKEFRSATWDKMGSVENDVSATERHIQKVLDFVDVEAIRAKKYKVVLDGCNGAGNTVSPRLLQILGCELVHINKELDGIFPHNPEPLPQNLVQLCEAVKEHGGDIGFAHDADADRVAIVTNDGEFIGEDYSLVWAVAHVLKNHKRGPVVTNLSTSMAVEAVAKPFDCPVHRAPVGDINVSGKMHEVGAVIGGEGNGGVIIPDIQFGRDGIAAIGLTLDFLTKEGKTAGDIHREIPRFYNRKSTVDFPNDKVPALLQWLKAKEKTARVDEQDGVKFLWPKEGDTTSWAHIRPSGTEPFVRVICEATTDAESRRIEQSMRDEIAELAAAL